MDRIALIGNIQQMRQIQCNLRVINKEISLDERVDAFKLHGGTVQVCLCIRIAGPWNIENQLWRLCVEVRRTFVFDGSAVVK
jgi:hypothetical protein